MAVAAPVLASTDPVERGEDARPVVTSDGLARDVRTVAIWTLVSRLTGFGRVAVMAAVLGPTYFGNLFLITSAIPAAAQDLFLGSMIAVLLVPALVRRIDASGDRLQAVRLANGLLGILMLFAIVAVGVALAAADMILDFITAAVADPTVRDRQRLLGWPLLIILMPQICLQVTIAVAKAVQNAHGRFALAAGAPAIENVGTILVLLIAALLFGIETEIEKISLTEAVLLALGSTAAVGLHTAVQWWGARRAGISLVPIAAWRDPDIRQLFRLAAPSTGNTLLATGTWLGLLVAAGSIPGGTVALQIGYSLFNLPIALGARPVATAQLPRLSRSALDHDGIAFQRIYRDSLAFARFVALPASLVFLLMPETLAKFVSFGRMASADGLALATAAIVGLGLGLIGEAVIVVATSASYARRDASAPLQAMAIRAAGMAVGIALAFSSVDAGTRLMTLCLALSAANLAAAALLHRRLIVHRPHLPASRGATLRADLLVGLLAVAPMALLAQLLADRELSQLESFLLSAGLLVLAGCLYLGVQWWRGAAALLAFRRRGASPRHETAARDQA